MTEIRRKIGEQLVLLLMCVMCFSITVQAGEADFNYVYEVDSYGNNKIIGFEYLENNYFFEYDERDIITYICDGEGNRIAYYCCDDLGNVTGIYSEGVEGWEINSDDSFIGNKNKVRWLGYRYDESSDCYIIDGRYFSVSEQKFQDGVDNEFAYSDINPFLFNEEGIMLVDWYDSDMAALEWSESLLADSTYGKAISHSSSWYSNLSTVELWARCIYCEGGTEYTREGDAVAWVILNRIHNSNFPDSPKAIITAKRQFASIIGESAETKDARIPSTNSSRWENATYLACLMLTTTDKTEWNTIVGNPINGQLYFYSYTYAKNHGGAPFSGTNSTSLYYDSSRITNVYVLGYGTVNSFSTLFSNYSPTVYSRNIYYDYY